MRKKSEEWPVTEGPVTGNGHDTFSTLPFHKKPDVDGFVEGRAVMLIFALNSTEPVNCTTPVPFVMN